MKYYLVKYEDNYANEFDVHGFKVFTEEELVDYKKEIYSKSFPIDIHFGNNEFVLYTDADDYFEFIEQTEISKVEYEFLSTAFGGSFGTFFDSNDFYWVSRI